MAARQTRNAPPKWTREEVIVALDVFQQHRDSLPGSKDHPIVVKLSERLRDLAAARGWVVTETFRNTTGCFMKLRQFKNMADPDQGLKNHSALDREIYARYRSDPIGLQLAVEAVSAGHTLLDESLPSDLEDAYTTQTLSAAPEHFLQTFEDLGPRGEAVVTPHVMTFGQLIKNEGVLHVPRYQRAYAWEEDQVTDFCRDLRELALKISQQGDEMAQHFFGGLVVVRRKASAGWDIIDGQQRATTMILTMVALQEAFEILARRAQLAGDTVTGEAAESNAEKTRVSYVWVEDSDPLTGKAIKTPRLDPTQQDRQLFEQLLSGNDYDPSRGSQQLLHEAKNTIWRELFAPLFRDPRTSDEERLRALLCLQLAAVTGSIVVRLAARDLGSAYRLFMVLNDRGMRLSEGDLLRAITLEALSNMTAHFEDAAQHWDTILSFDATTVQGFLRSYFPSVMGIRADIRNIVDEYSHKYFKLKDTPIVTGVSAKDLVAKIKAMSEEISAYSRMATGKWPYDSEDVPKAHLVRPARLLRTLKHELAMPLLLAGVRQLTQPDFTRMILLLERFAFSYKNVLGGHADPAMKEYYKHAATLRGRTQGANWTYEDLATPLRQLLQEAGYNDVFQDRLVAQLTYARVGQRTNIKWLLAAFEDFYSWLHPRKNQKVSKEATLNTNVVLDADAAQIDHVYPQSARDEDCVPDLEEVKHLLGNLALLGAKDNRIASNTMFAEKRSYYKEYDIRMTRALARNKTWNSKKVTDRGLMLAHEAARLCTI